MAIGVAKYVKNVGKSIAYATIDIIKEDNAPGISSFISESSDITKKVYASVKSLKEKAKNSSKTIDKAFIKAEAKDIFSGAYKSLKTGDFYNAQSDDDSFGGLFDDDDSFNFDSSDDDIDTSDNVKTANSKIGKSIGTAINANSATIAKSAELVIKSKNASSKAILSQMDVMNTTISSNIGALYNKMNHANEFLDGPLTAHLNNSKTYYENMTKMMQDQTAMIKELVETNRKIYGTADSNSKKSTNPLQQSMGFDGSFNLEGYLKNIKSNVDNSMIGMLLGLGNMVASLSDFGSEKKKTPYEKAKDFIKGSVNDMPKNILKSGIKKILGEKFQNSLQNLDNGITSLFSNIIAKINKKKGSVKNGELLQLALDIFGIDIKEKTSINTSNYKKGPIPFDGETKKAITEVIPGYLSRIEAAITGLDKGGEKYYDYKNGSWRSRKEIQSKFEEEKYRGAYSTGSDIRHDLSSTISDLRKKSEKEAKDFEKFIQNMSIKIYEDGGVFDPRITNVKTMESSGDAWKKYGAKNKAQFDLALKNMKKSTIRGMAYNAMKAKQNLSDRMNDLEENGSIYDILFNDNNANNSNSQAQASSSKGIGILSSSRDETGKNIFWYLREILNKMDSGRRNNGKQMKSNYSRNSRSSKTTTSSESSDSSKSEGEESSDSDDDSGQYDIFKSLEEEEKKEKEKESKKDVNKIKTWIKNKFGDTKIGKWISRKSNSDNNALFKGPIKYMTELLDRADNAMFKMMFGDNEYKDEHGQPIDSVFGYIMIKIRKSFEELNDWLHQLFDPIAKKVKNFFKEKVKPVYEKYVQPIIKSTGEGIHRAATRVKTAFSDTFGKGAKNVAEDINDGDVIDSSDIKESAYGRVVTKRGLTMISPGEVILPSTFDRKEQNRQLKEEKKEKSKIEKALGKGRLGGIPYNAKGTISKEDIDAIIKEIKTTGKYKISDIGSGGLLGGGAGLLLGINPILSALVGSAISFTNKSAVMKDILFGKQNDEGKRTGDGIIPKKVLNIFDKYGKDMTDLGIVGGIAGLLTPFGVVGGAAIGAGLGFLKNNESFKKFVFGSLENGEDGLISKKSFDKFKSVFKDNLPRMGTGAAIGAGIGLITGGPFGILGNAVLGAATGLVSTTDFFHKLVFGDDNESNTGILGAIKEGVIDPFKNKVKELTADATKYLKEQIANPFKEFAKALTQSVKNIVTSINDTIKDSIKKTFDTYIGVPVRDFLLQKIFKPIGNVFGKVFNTGFKLVKNVVAFPFSMLGNFADKMRVGQIKKGKAYDMSAKERIAFRNKNKKIKSKFNRKIFGKDEFLKQDEYLANLSKEELEAYSDTLSGLSGNSDEINKKLSDSSIDIENSLSSFFRGSNGSNGNIYDSIGYKNAKKIYEAARSGNKNDFEKLVNSSKLSDDQKKQLIGNLTGKIDLFNRNKNLSNMASKSDEEKDDILSKAFGRSISGKGDRRDLRRAIDAEIKARIRDEAKANLDLGDNSEDKTKDAKNIKKSPITVIETKADEIIEVLKKNNEYLRSILTKDSSVIDRENKEAKEEADAKSFMEGKFKNDDVSDAVNDVKDVSEIDPDQSKLNMSVFNFGAGKKKKRRKFFDLFHKNKDEEVNKDSKEYKEYKDKEEESTSNEKLSLSLTQSTNNNIKSLTKEITGESVDEKGKKDKGKGKKLLNGIGFGFKKLLGFMGVFGKVVGGITLAGYASEWLKTSVWPTVKKIVFGTENQETGAYEHGLIPSLGGFLLGNKVTGEKGVVGRITDWLGNKIKDIAEFFPKFLSEKLLPIIINGIGLASENIVAPLTEALLIATPKIVEGVVKGILNYLTGKNSSGGNVGDGNSGIDRETAANYGLTVNDNGEYTAKDGTVIQTGKFAKNKKTPLKKAIKGTAQTFLATAGGLISGNSKLASKLSKVSVNGFKHILPTPKGVALGAGISGVKATAKGAGAVTNAAGKAGQVANKGLTGFFANVKNAARKAQGKKAINVQEILQANADKADSIIKNINETSLIGKFKKGFAEKKDSILKKIAGEGAENVVEEGIEKAATGKLSIGKALAKRLKNTKAGAYVSGVGAGIKNAVKGTKVGKLATKASEKIAGWKSGASNFISGKLSSAKDSLISKFGKKATKEVAEEGSEKAAKKGMNSLFEKLANSKVGDKICSIIGGEGIKSKVQKMLLDLSESLSKHALGKGGAKAAASLAKAVGKINPIGIALAIADFLSGYNNAASILGVAKGDEYNVSVAQKVVCGLLNTILNLIPVINMFVGPDDIVDLAIKYVFPLFGWDTSELSAARDRADDVLAKWNAEHPEEQYSTLEAYNKKDSWMSKIKKKMKKVTKSIFGKGKSDESKESKSTYDAGTGKNKSIVDIEYEKKVKNDKNLSAGRGRHNYQRNKAIANIKYGDSTIGEAGCAPVAASNVINRMTNGYSSVADAANYAETHNMTVKGGGTDINYFNSYFNNKGIPNYSTTSKNDVMKAIKNGNQVVMLGKDSSDSKNAPFGSNPHFITAVGTDRRGNIIAEDPDMPQSTIAYNKNKVLGSMIKSVVAGSSRRSRISRPKFNGKGRRSLRLYGRSRGLGPEGIINIAYSQIGKMATIDNQVVYNDVFYGYHAYGPNYGWCCVFVWWCFNQAGAEHLLPVKTGRCADLMSAFSSRGQLVDDPKMGDIAFMNFNGGSNAAHVGIVIGVEKDGKVITIDGNTTVGDSNNAPYGVEYKVRPRKYFVGFARPTYPYEYNEKSVVNMEDYDDYTDYYSMAHNYDSESESITDSVDSAMTQGNAASSGTNQVINSSNTSNANRKTTSSGVPIVTTSVPSYKVKSTASSSVNSNDKYAKYSSLGDIFSIFTQLGSNILKAWIGEDRYNALFNSGSNTSDSESTTSTDADESVNSTSSETQSTSSSNSNNLSLEELRNIGKTSTTSNNSSTSTANNSSVNKNLSTTAAVNSIASSASSGDLATEKTGTVNGDYANSLSASDNAKYIWNALSKKGVYTKAGLAGIMGNLEQESGYKPANVENTYEYKYGDDVTYTSRVDNGTYTRDQFIGAPNNPDGHHFGYGLPGWTYYTLKEGLYDNTVGKKKSLGDMDSQINYLHDTISNIGEYKGLYNTLTTTDNVDEAADAMLENYERPYGFSMVNGVYDPNLADQRTREYNTRRSNAERVYSIYAGSGRKHPGISASKALSGRARIANTGLSTKSIRNINNDSNTAIANSTPTVVSNVTNYASFLESIVEILVSIADNTAMLNKIISILSDNFNIKVDPSDISSVRSQARDKAKQSLNELIKRTNGNNLHVSNLLENNGTQAIIAQMAMLARE